MNLAESELVVDKGRAEHMLFALATELRVVPLGSSTTDLHMRALKLKGAVARWTEETPDKHTRETVCDEVLLLWREAHECCLRLRAASGRR
jgi:hypothetical protein